MLSCKFLHVLQTWDANVGECIKTRTVSRQDLAQGGCLHAALSTDTSLQGTRACAAQHLRVLAAQKAICSDFLLKPKLLAIQAPFPQSASAWETGWDLRGKESDGFFRLAQQCPPRDAEEKPRP